MTTVAFDGRYFAADSATSCGYIPFKIDKIKIIGTAIVSGTGYVDEVFASIDWLKDQSKDKPSINNENQAILWVDSRDKIPYILGHLLHKDRLVFKPNPNLAAVGSGCQAAMAAMYLGKNAIEAVCYACLFDKDTKSPIHYVDLDADVLEIKEFQEKEKLP